MLERPSTLLAVVAGGAMGAVLRWSVDLALPHPTWPWGTLLVNVLGCLALGALSVLLPPDRWWRPFLGTGVLGGFTTFSTYVVQVVVLQDRHPALALLYLVLTPVLCVGAAAAGRVLGDRAAPGGSPA